MKSRKKKILKYAAAAAIIAAAFTAGIISAAPGSYGNGKLFDNDQTWHYEALRSMGYTYSRAADISEVLYTVSRIERGNRESWVTEWSSLAERTFEISGSYSKDRTARGESQLRASNYYRTAEFMIEPDDPKRMELYDSSVSAFYAGLETLGTDYRLDRIPWKQGNLESLFVPGDFNSKGKTLIVVINGYDSIKEETWFTLGYEANLRGYSFLSYDGPGQGASIRKEGLPMTSRWEDVNPVVLDDVLRTSPEIEHVILVGFSLGSILASRAAAYDERVDGLVHFDIFYDFSTAVGTGMPSSFRERVFSDEKPPESLNKMLKWSMKFDSKTDWSLKHGAWVMGMGNDYLSVLRSYRDFEMESIADDIKVPVLLLAGKEDHFVPYNLAEKTQNSLRSAPEITLISYTEETGGSEHCQVGAQSRWTADLFQWLSEHQF